MEIYVQGLQRSMAQFWPQDFKDFYLKVVSKGAVTVLRPGTVTALSFRKSAFFRRDREFTKREIHSIIESAIFYAKESKKEEEAS
jgi:hypothetical protein